MAALNWLRRLRDGPRGNSSSYWDAVYSAELGEGRVREDHQIVKLLPLLRQGTEILDFGSGPGGNVMRLSQDLTGCRFHLVDHSEQALRHAADKLLGDEDERGNRFFFHAHSAAIAEQSMDTVLAIQVLEHLRDFRSVIDTLWGMVRPGGRLIVSVPVKGRRDRHREHINKFTVDSMFKELARLSSWVQVAPRTYSKRSGILATAFFCVERPHRSL